MMRTGKKPPNSILLSASFSVWELTGSNRRPSACKQYLRKLDLSDRQIKTIIYTKEHKKISNKVYQQLFNVSRNTASNDLQQLVKAKLLISNEQKGAGSFYTIRGIAQ